MENRRRRGEESQGKDDHIHGLALANNNGSLFVTFLITPVVAGMKVYRPAPQSQHPSQLSILVKRFSSVFDPAEIGRDRSMRTNA